MPCRSRPCVLILAIFLFAGCDRKAATPMVGPGAPSLKGADKPVAFLGLKEPVEPAEYEGKKIDTAPAGRLRAVAKQLSANGKHADAARHEYWACKKDGGEYYNLACYYGLAANTDAALYWLQKAGTEEGIDLAWTKQDSDLETVRLDPRWKGFTGFLAQCERYWTANAKPMTTLVLPKGYDAKSGKPLWTVVWLHGMGSRPDQLVNPKDEDGMVRGWADDLGIAFVGISGTQAKGTRNFVWAENAEKDMARVRQALDEVKDRLVVQPGGVIAMGFSQGAQTGLELAARHPDVFAGAIVLSPGSNTQNLSQVASPSAELKKRGFIIGCGAQEHPGNVAQSKAGVDWAKAAGAKVDLQLFAGQQAHTFPKDVNDLFPKWIAFIRAANGK